MFGLERNTFPLVVETKVARESLVCIIGATRLINDQGVARARLCGDAPVPILWDLFPYACTVHTRRSTLYSQYLGTVA